VPAERPLVGRAEELALCSEALAGDDGPGIVVAGAAGVGKTRLAAELLDAVETAGTPTVRMTATEAGRGIPLAPFAPLLPAPVDATGPLELLRLAREAVCRHGDGRRVVLLVDDAYLLDPASATLVQQLAAGREAIVVATVRSGEPVPDAIVALWKDHGCAYLELQPLSREETGLLAESLVGGEIDGQTKHELWEASRGVPLFVQELVLGGLEQRLLVEHEGLWRWHGALEPTGRLLDLMEARIGQLDEAERGLLELVALGEPLGWSLLEPVEATGAERLVRRGVLAAEQDRRRLVVRLAHPLFGEAVRTRMPPAQTAAHYRRLADALEATGMRRAGEPLRVAFWRLESGGSASPDLLLGAWRIAEDLGDDVLAERLARAAVDADGGFEAELALAWALNHQMRLVEAEAVLASLATAARTDKQRADVAIARASVLMRYGRSTEAASLLAAAEAAVSDEAPRRLLERNRALTLAMSGRQAEALPAYSALLEHADGERERGTVAALTADALAEVGRGEDALALIACWAPIAEEATGPTFHARVPTSYVRGTFRGARCSALLYLGRPAEAGSVAADAYDVFVGAHWADLAAFMALLSGRVALVEGCLERARSGLRESTALMREGRSELVPCALALTAQALGQAGDAADANRAAIEAAECTGEWFFDPDLLLGRAWAAAAAGALSESRQTALEALDLAEKRGALSLAFLAAHDLARLGDPAAAAPRLAHLAGQVQGALVQACAEHAQALLAGDARRLEAAAEAFTELGALLWAAEAESAAAAAHREAGRQSSARAATTRAALLLERCGGAQTPALAAAGPADELTPREREIAALAAGGASNDEIAARLVISVRTVENHLQHAYRKLGVRRRTDLPAVLTTIE